MINPLAAYHEAGSKSGRAMRHNDTALSRHWYNWAQKAMRLESAEYRRECQKEFDQAYREAAASAARSTGANLG